MTYVIAAAVRRPARTRPASRSAPSTASTRASGCSTSTPTSASTAVPASRSARSRRSSTRTTSRSSGRTTTTANVDFFDDLGSPGGAAKIGKIDKDHPLVAALPPQRDDERLTPRPAEPGRRRLGAAARTSPGTSSRRTATRGARAPGRHRRPVGRHAGRPGARRRPGRRWPRRPTRPGYPLTAGTPRAAAGGRRLAGPPATASPGSTATAVLPTIGSKELVAWLPTLLGLGPGDRGRAPRAGLPDVRGRRAARRRRGACATDSLTALGPDAGSGWSGSTRPSQPDRPGAAAPSTCARSSTGPASAARVRGLRRVLPRAGLGRRRRSRCCTPTSAAATHDGHARGALAVQALQPGRLPGRRSSPATRRWSAELLAVRKHARPDDARPRCRRRWRRARRRRARRASSARGTRAPARALRAALRGGRVPDRALRGRRSTCGRPATSLLGHGRAGWPSGASWSRRATSTAPAGARHVRVALTATDERVAAAVGPAHGLTRAVRRRARPARPRPRAGRCAAHLP